MKTESKRLLLRPMQAEDCKAIFAYRSDAQTNQYQSWIPESLEEVKQFIAKNPKQFNTPETWFQLVIIEKESQTIIGDIGIHFIDSDNQQCEIGSTLSKAYQGQAYATEALKAVIDYLFDKLNKHRIIASIDPDNTNSIRLVERLGFRKEAHFKQSLFINNQWVDDVIYAVLRREWES